jgi:hypothetical protein
MANALKKIKIERDRFTEDGVRMFNPSKEHGTVYADGFIEVKYIQEYEGREIHYRGDGTPVGYKMGTPLPKHADELLTENEQLQNKVKDLESAQARTNELLARLMAKLEEGKGEPGAATDTGSEPPKATGSAKAAGGSARGASQPK